MGGPTLHEFMNDHRDELFAMTAGKIKDHSPELNDEEVGADIQPILNEIVGALEREDGLPATSPLPGKSITAGHLGSLRQHRGYPIDKLALDLGSISDSLGELGARHGLSFTAREYQVFNTCIDNAVSSALDTFWNESVQQEESYSTKRVGLLAHELRNALIGAKSAFEVLKRGHLGIQSRTGEVLGRNLGRLENIVSQTLLAVQLQAGLTAKLQRMRLIDLLRDLEETAVPERGIRLKVEADPGLELEVDESVMVSAGSNLLQNAFKFSKEYGEVVLRGRKDGECVIIEVEDECGGLPPGRPEELFTPFGQRGEDRRGLGLAITREAVEASGGELSVRNLPGKGCVFSIKLSSACEHEGGSTRRD